jgi:hypothetical protein
MTVVFSKTSVVPAKAGTQNRECRHKIPNNREQLLARLLESAPSDWPLVIEVVQAPPFAP